ncbi:hypothetical protein [Rhizobium sp. 57MFTsu3.2]|uniref:hypothetical protein n=1 Tax=Rhizobium sp. 57MFTsu3.2 TaxID=1048681 RepID=UPI00146A6841|nr:hypothetical protein [Rhizobium sp. 57MFTsu3.2]
MFRVIAGGRQKEQERVTEEPCKILQEGHRRLRKADIQRYEARERVAGIPMPLSLKHYKVQVEYVIAALSKLDPLPPDYMSDGYWPSFENADRQFGREGMKG